MKQRKNTRIMATNPNNTSYWHKFSSCFGLSKEKKVDKELIQDGELRKNPVAPKKEVIIVPAVTRITTSGTGIFAKITEEQKQKLEKLIK